MRAPASIALVCEGDALSGNARPMAQGLRDIGHEVRPVDVRPPSVWRAVQAALTFSPNRGRWRSRFRYGTVASTTRSVLAASRLRRLAPGAEVVLQIGATFRPPASGEVPYAIYADWNMALSSRFRNAGLTAASGLSEAALRQLDAYQRDIYQGAAAIFTISQRLRDSFIEDYGLLPERVVVAYPGANVEPGIPERGAQRPPGPPRVLFVGVEFERKGGPVLVEAFRAVRRELPDARLAIVGPRDLSVSQDGVEVLGHLRKDVLEQRERLLRSFVEADVFCLPSRIDPFPNVVREAMWYGLPCVTTDFFAMPEMVVEGETGFTVAPGDAAALADRLIRVLRNHALGRRMGAAGRRRVEERFTWDRCAQVLHTHLQLARDAHAAGVPLSSPASPG